MNKDIIVSSRVRLARNLKDYSFPSKLTVEKSVEITATIRNVLKDTNYKYIDINQNSRLDNLILVENHMISADMLKNDLKRAVFIHKKNESSVMVNEEDHIRIQSIVKGNDIEQAYDNANEIDNKLEKKLKFAYDKEYGYLTACPTNVGTGMRASYMVHLPILEASNQMKNTLIFLGKLGITARGMYGEGTESRGSLYQISNQATLGLSEKEIIERLKDVVMQIINQEIKIREKIYKEQKLKFSDEVYRAYGTLTNAKLMTAKEAMLLLSYIKLGIDMDIMDKQFVSRVNIFELMVKIQKANIEKRVGRKLSIIERDEERARIIQGELI